MAKYVVVDGRKKFNGKVYEPGENIDCAEDIALRLRLTPVIEENPVVAETEKIPVTAAEKIAAIAGCKDVAEVDLLIEGESRKTVLDAAEKAKRAFEATKEQ